MSAPYPSENEWLDPRSSESSSEVSSAETEDMLKWKYPTHSSFIVDRNNPPKYEFSSDTDEETTAGSKYSHKIKSPSKSSYKDGSKVYLSESVAQGEGMKVYNSGAKMYNTGSEVFRQQGLKSYNSGSKVYNEGLKEYFNERSKKFVDDGSKRMYNQELRKVYKAEAKEIYSAGSKPFAKEAHNYNKETQRQSPKYGGNAEAQRPSIKQEMDGGKISFEREQKGFVGEQTDSPKMNPVTLPASTGYQSPIYSAKKSHMSKSSFFSYEKVGLALVGAFGLLLFINLILTSILLEKVSDRK